MILGAEIGLLIMGIYALATGKLTLTKRRVVRGTRARLLAIIALLPIPITVLLGMILGIIFIGQGRSVSGSEFRWMATGIEAGVVVLCVIALYAIGWRLAEPES